MTAAPKEAGPAEGEAASPEVALEDSTAPTVATPPQTRINVPRFEALAERLHPTGATAHLTANGSVVLLAGGCVRAFSDIADFAKFVADVVGRRGGK